MLLIEKKWLQNAPIKFTYIKTIFLCRKYLYSEEYIEGFEKFPTLHPSTKPRRYVLPYCSFAQACPLPALDRCFSLQISLIFISNILMIKLRKSRSLRRVDNSIL
jgi:hypothetical protein